MRNDLKKLVTEYKHPPNLPPFPDHLPRNPDGSLYGIGFFYDEDRDDRVLDAIETLSYNRDIVAVMEHEGHLEIYTRKPTGLAGSHISVCGSDDVVHPK